MAGPDGADVPVAEDEKEEWSKEMEEELKEEAAAEQVAAEQTAEFAGHETELLSEMKEAVKAAGIPVEGVTDHTFMRFLRARTMSIPKASALYVDDVKWRKEYLGPNGVQPSEIESEMKANKSYLVAKDGERPWLYLYGKNHDTYTRDLEQFRRFAVFVLERAIETFAPGVEQFGVVLDLGDCAYRNLDSRGMINLFDTLQAHYPERMSRLYVVHVPYIFWGVWKVVKPLIDPRTRQKIRFVEDRELNQVLSEEIPNSMLPKLYGGEAELVGHWEKFGTHRM